MCLTSDHTSTAGGQTKVANSKSSKYVIGADGGNSAVRRLADIEFLGDDTTDRWIRIDGIFKTDMPDADIGFAAIESESHGNVLWVQLDHGVNRIGFTLKPDAYAKYGDGITIEEAKEEARKAIAPFKLEISRVDWWTLYQ
jgi:phenol 2-monooxygenase (NADPH)